MRFLPVFCPLIRLALLSPGLVTLPAYAQRSASFAAGARSSTTSNTMLEDVVGNRNSPVKSQTKATGAKYRITANGTIIAPNGLVVNEGCTLHGSLRARQKSRYHFTFSPPEKDFETVLVGISTQSDKNHRATLNTSFAPSNVYVVPSPCIGDEKNDRALTLGAAASLASVNGNIFTLAGNRKDVIEADTASTLPNGDITLTSTPPYGPSDVRVGP